jgi:transposase-like protein
MKFGVIVCPQCKQVKGIELSSKTTKCIRCGKTLQLKKLQIFYETDSQEKLRQAIGLLNAELDTNSSANKKFLFDKHASK